MKRNYKLITSDEPKKFNLSGVTPILGIESIPTLIPEKSLKTIQAGDPDPYYKLQEIDISEPANGLYYTHEFWESYLNKISERPIPGSKDGHHVGLYERPPTDFYLVGGKLDKKNNKVYLKNYIPPEGDVTINNGFIRDLKADIVHFSIVSYTKDKIYMNEDGNIEKIEVVESLRGERNDAVEYGMGAMTQKTNKEGRKLNGPGVSNAKARIRSNDINSSGSWSFSSSDGNKLLGPDGDDWANYGKWHLAENTSATEKTKARYSYPFGKGGKVYRSALVAIRQRAGQQNDTSIFDAAGILIEALDKKIEKSNSMEVKKMELKEILEKLGNMKTNGELNINQIAEVLGIPVVTKEHQEALELIEKLNKKLNTDDIESAVDEMISNKDKVEKESFELLRNKKMTEAFGPEKNGDAENLKRNAAELIVTKNIVDEAELDKQVEEAKNNSVVKSFSYADADYTSEVNDISGVDKTKNNKSKFSGEFVTL